MKVLRALALGLGFASSPATVDAEPPAPVEKEIDFLITDIGGSGCEFERNGSWADAATAQAHIRSKYERLVARQLIDDTEDFIEKAASVSSLSGRPYEVRCGGGEPVTSEAWLHEELRRFRARP